MLGSCSTTGLYLQPFYFKTESIEVAQEDVELAILLSQPPNLLGF